jgi:hypothetical protein
MNDTQREYLSTTQFGEYLKSFSLAHKDDASLELPKVNPAKTALVLPVPVEVKALGGADSRLVEFVITSDRVDREQDTIDPEGWDFKDYENNPVVLWCHDHYAPVIGNARSLTRSKNTWKSITEFTPQDLNPFGYMIYRLYAEKFMHAVSVGFYPIEYTLAADRKWGVNYVKQGMLEYSCVPVPANPDALAVARSKGIDLKPMKQWAEKVLDETWGQSDEARRRTEVLRAVSAPGGRALILDLGVNKMAEKEPETTTAKSVVKKMERWACSVKDHAHESEAEAQACESFDLTVTEAIRSLQTLQALVKSGKIIRAESGALLKAIMAELVPEKTPEAPAKGADEKQAVTTKDGKVDKIVISEEAILAAINETVGSKVAEMTGRVD